jgi:hypothetical protein
LSIKQSLVGITRTASRLGRVAKHSRSIQNCSKNRQLKVAPLIYQQFANFLQPKVSKLLKVDGMMARFNLPAKPDCKFGGGLGKYTRFIYAIY